MVKVLTVEREVAEDGVFVKHQCMIYADSKDEVTSDVTVAGIGNISSLAAGSTCITGDFDVGILKSDGTWSWA